MPIFLLPKNVVIRKFSNPEREKMVKKLRLKKFQLFTFFCQKQTFFLFFSISEIFWKIKTFLRSKQRKCQKGPELNSHLRADKVKDVSDVDADASRVRRNDVLILANDALHNLLREARALQSGELKIEAVKRICSLRS